MSAKKKPGRPAAAIPRTKRVPVLVSDDEHWALHRVSGFLGADLADLIRRDMGEWLKRSARIFGPVMTAEEKRRFLSAESSLSLSGLDKS